ncbi:MAG: hypothetical protein ACRECY_10965, partial [Phyllobacterium sp.]
MLGGEPHIGHSNLLRKDNGYKSNCVATCCVFDRRMNAGRLVAAHRRPLHIAAVVVAMPCRRVAPRSVQAPLPHSKGNGGTKDDGAADKYEQPKKLRHGDRLRFKRRNRCGGRWFPGSGFGDRLCGICICRIVPGFQPDYCRSLPSLPRQNCLAPAGRLDKTR